MAHDITHTDHLVLTGKRAWHGLGTIVENAPTAGEALATARLNWTVQRMPVSALGMDGSTDIADDYRALRRSDTNELFAIVGEGYKPVQNATLAEFADAMGADGSVKIESAGSIRGGRRVWFLARGESVWANDRDETKTYLLLAAGHDGTMSVVVQPTSVRVVCKNTLHLALGGKRKGIRFSHEGDIRTKLNEAKAAIGVLSASTDNFRKQVAALVARDMSREDLQRFWVDVYSELEAPIPTNPTNADEREQVRDARATLSQWAGNFDRDRQSVGGGANAWSALNAITEWFDHQRTVRAKDDAARVDARIYNKLWGVGSENKGKALDKALALV